MFKNPFIIGQLFKVNKQRGVILWSYFAVEAEIPRFYAKSVDAYGNSQVWPQAGAFDDFEACKESYDHMLDEQDYIVVRDMPSKDDVYDTVLKRREHRIESAYWKAKYLGWT